MGGPNLRVQVVSELKMARGPSGMRGEMGGHDWGRTRPELDMLTMLCVMQSRT